MAYDKDRNYAQEIKDAMANGADQSVVNDLNRQRNEKIAANQDYYASKGISSNDGHAADVYLYNQQKSSGGSSGKSGGSFSYGSAPSYTSKYSDQINDLVQQILNSSYGGFKAGDEYSALQQSYTKNGQKAMQDTLGQVSARTGGLASSYAGAASQQTYDSYMDALEQAAMEMYQTKLSGDRNNLSLLSGLESADYAKYADQLSQWNADRGFNYGVDSDNRNFNYQAGRDAVSDNRYNQEYADSRSDYGDSRGDAEYNKQLTQAQTLAQYGDFSGYKALGYTDAQISSMKKQWQVEQAVAAAKAKQKSATGSSIGNSGKPKLTLAQAQKAIESGQVSQSVVDTIDYYYGTGYYQKWYGDGGNYTVTNRNGDGWVNIDGLGRFTYDELQSKVDSGAVTETIDRKKGTVTYTKS